MRLKEWNAKRSAAAISIRGLNADTGQPDRITNVSLIHPARKEGVLAIAIGPDGREHELL